MVRAVLRGGLIQLIDPLPPEWTDGRELRIDDLQAPSSTDVDHWAKELDRLAKEIDEADAEAIQTAVAKVRRQDREMARRQTGLP